MDALHEVSDSGDLNVYAAGEQFVVEVPVPGIKPRDITVRLEDRTLTIRAEPKGKTDFAKRTYLLHGHRPASLTRRIRLPDSVDLRSGRGSLEAGLLRLSFRQDTAPRRCQIPVRADGPAIVPLERVESDSPSAPSSGARLSSTPNVARPMTNGRSSLSPREQEVLRLLADGRTNKEIAGRLVISVATVNYHVSSILTKLGAENRTQAAVIVSQHRLLPETACPR
jgi:DNA-binding CsgD family transcriptional regulator/HSP20 family molecular chaperone IbpA